MSDDDDPMGPPVYGNTADPREAIYSCAVKCLREQGVGTTTAVALQRALTDEHVAEIHNELLDHGVVSGKTLARIFAHYPVNQKVTKTETTTVTTTETGYGESPQATSEGAQTTTTTRTVTSATTEYKEAEFWNERLEAAVPLADTEPGSQPGAMLLRPFAIAHVLKAHPLFSEGAAGPPCKTKSLRKLERQRRREESHPYDSASEQRPHRAVPLRNLHSGAPLIVNQRPTSPEDRPATPLHNAEFW